MSIKDCQYIFHSSWIQRDYVWKGQNLLLGWLHLELRNGFNNFKKHDISLMSNDSPRKSATLRATLFDKASVNKNMRATNSIYIFSHIETEKNPWSSRHFDGICRTDVKKTSNARSRDSSPHLSPNEKWSQRTWQWQWLPYWRGNMTPRRERCVGKITSPLGTISSTYIHVYIQIMYGFISPWNHVLSR